MSMYNSLASLLRLDQIIELGQLTEQLNSIAYRIWRTTSPPASHDIVVQTKTYSCQASRNQLHKALQYTVLTTQEQETPYLIIGWRGTVHLEHIMVDLEDAPASHTFAKHENSFLTTLNTLVSNQEHNKKITIVFSGHSLGGSLAQLCVASLTALLHKQHANPGQPTHSYLTPDTIEKIILTTANSPGIEEKTIHAFSQSSAYLSQHTTIALHALLLRTQGDLTQHHCSQIASGGTWTSRRIIIRPGLQTNITEAPQEIWHTLRGDGLQAGLSRTANTYLDLEKTHIDKYLTRSKALADTPIRIIHQTTDLTEELLQSGLVVFSSTCPSVDTQLLNYLKKDKDIRHLETLRLVMKKTIPKQQEDTEEKTHEGKKPSLDKWVTELFQDTATLAVRQAQEKRAEKQQEQRKIFWHKILQVEHQKNAAINQKLLDSLMCKNQQEQRLTNTIWTMILKVNILEDMLTQKNLASILGWHCMQSAHFELSKWDIGRLWKTGIRKAHSVLTSVRPITNYNNWLALHDISSNQVLAKLWGNALKAVLECTQLHGIFGLGLATKALEKKQNSAIRTLHTCLSAAEKAQENKTSIIQQIEHLHESIPHTIASGELQKHTGKR